MGDERDRIIRPEEVAGAVLGGALHPGLVLTPQAMPRELEARGGGGPPLARSGIIDIDGMDQGRMDPNLCDGRVWGSPMRIRQGSQQCIDTDARVDTDPSWGRADTILWSDGPHTMARVTLNSSEMLQLSVDVPQPPTGFSVWAIVDYGGGSTSVRKVIRCDYRQDLPVVACFLQVSVYIGDKFGKAIANLDFGPGGEFAPPPAQVAVQVSRGVRGLPYVASNFITSDIVSEGVLIAAPARLLSVTAHLTAVQGAPVFLQLLDESAFAIAIAGAKPEAEYALGTAPNIDIDIRYINPRAFARGVTFVTSTTSGSIPAGGAAGVHIEVEQLVL